MNQYWVYLLYSSSFEQTYVGHTNNLENRLSRHNQGLGLSTRRYCPWEMIYFEEFPTRSSAMKREKYFKSGLGREEVKAILIKHLGQNGLLHPPQADALR
jgi:putative endonuclease